MPVSQTRNNLDKIQRSRAQVEAHVKNNNENVPQIWGIYLSVLEGMLKKYNILKVYEGSDFWNSLIDLLDKRSLQLKNMGQEVNLDVIFYIMALECSKLAGMGSDFDELASIVKGIIDNSEIDYFLPSEDVEIFNRYNVVEAENFDDLRKGEERKKLVEQEVRNALSKLENTQASILKRMEQTQESLKAAQGKTSFVSVYEGLSSYSRKVRFSLWIVRFLRCVLMALMVCIPIALYLNIMGEESESQQREALATLSTISENGTDADRSNGSDEKSFVGSIMSGVDSYSIKYAFIYISGILLLLYFFRILLKEERELERIFHGLEFKAAMTSFHNAYLEVVREAGGDVSGSISNYEGFVYRDIARDGSEVPQVTDGINEVLSNLEKIVKAARRGK